MGKDGGFKLVFQRRYMLLIGLMVLTFNTVNTNGEFILGETVTAQSAVEAAELVPAGSGDDAAHQAAVEKEQGKIIGAFYGDFFFYVNILTALLQLFIVSRVFKYIGVRAALFVLPLIAFGGYAAIAFIPLLGVLKIAKIIENSTDYSLQNTTRQALFLPASREEKYKAKAAIDTFFVRFGDVASFGIVYAATTVLHLAATTVALFNLVLVALWIALAVGIARHHKRLASGLASDSSRG